jgi:antitoxin component YwqK of YwqJK toxin-antitoxin module
MTRIESSRLSYDAESGRHTLDGVPFTGVVFSVRPNGHPEAESELRDGLNWGFSRSWYSTGAKLGEAEMRAGVLHGRAKEWHKNGQLASEGEYEYGITLWERKWDENGTLLSDYQLKPSDRQYRNLEQRRRVYGRWLDDLTG